MKFTITKQSYPKPNETVNTDFRIFQCFTNDSSIDTMFGRFSITGNNLVGMIVGSEYDGNLQLKEHNKYGYSYILTEEVETKVDNFTYDEQVSIMESITTPSQAMYVLQAYPDFVNMIINGEEDKIDTKNIYNVGEYYKNTYIEKIKNNLAPLSAQRHLKKYEISVAETKKLLGIYGNAEEILKDIEANPYKFYIDVLERKFDNIDSFILSLRPELYDSEERCEWCVIDILKANEEDGNTRMNANEMASYVPRELKSKLVSVVTKSEYIHYDSETKFISTESRWRQERFIAEKLIDILNNGECLGINTKNYKEKDGITLTDEQKSILDTVNESSVAMLIGFSGSGKSYTTKSVIDMLEEENISYKLLAPTGIASKVLSKYTDRKATTIHSAYYSSGDEDWSETVIICDEFGMVSLDTMEMICSKITKHQRLLFVCDAAQLASISCGNVLKDIQDSNIIPTVQLTKVFRYGVGGIATVATNIRNNNPYVTHSGNLLFDMKEKDFEFRNIESEPIEQIIDAYKDALNMYDYKDITITSPFNVGNYGNKIINNRIQEEFNTDCGKVLGYKMGKIKVNFKKGDKVCNIKNQRHALLEGEYYYKQDLEWQTSNNLLPDDYVPETFPDVYLANGDIGIVNRVDDDAVFVDFDIGTVVYPKGNLTNLILAYALSTHKLQGSQSKCIIMIASKAHSKMLTRNLLYVASTRAEKYLIQIGDVDAIQGGMNVEETQIRDTWLKDFICELSSVENTTDCE